MHRPMAALFNLLAACRRLARICKETLLDECCYPAGKTYAQTDIKFSKYITRLIYASNPIDYLMISLLGLRLLQFKIGRKHNTIL